MTCTCPRQIIQFLGRALEFEIGYRSVLFAQVGIIMGSDSDLPTMKAAAQVGPVNYECLLLFSTFMRCKASE